MIEEAKRQAALAAEAAQQGLPEWAAEMAKAVPTSLIRDLVADNRRVPPSEPATPVARATGRSEVPLGPRPANELALLDRIVERFAGGPNSIK